MIRHPVCERVIAIGSVCGNLEPATGPRCDQIEHLACELRLLSVSNAVPLAILDVSIKANRTGTENLRTLFGGDRVIDDDPDRTLRARCDAAKEALAESLALQVLREKKR